MLIKREAFIFTVEYDVNYRIYQVNEVPLIYKVFIMHGCSFFSSNFSESIPFAY